MCAVSAEKASPRRHLGRNTKHDGARICRRGGAHSLAWTGEGSPREEHGEAVRRSDAR